MIRRGAPPRASNYAQGPVTTTSFTSAFMILGAPMQKALLKALVVTGPKAVTGL